MDILSKHGLKNDTEINDLISGKYNENYKKNSD